MEKVFIGLSCLIAGYFVSWLQFRYIWINQKRHEIKFSILDDAARALALYEREALDPIIQSQKRPYNTKNGTIMVPKIEFTTETQVLRVKTLVKTKALFSDDAYKALDKVLKTPLKLEEAAGEIHHNFIKDSELAIDIMCKELRGDGLNWLGSLIKRWIGKRKRAPRP